jgi:hypothetical protein
MVLLTNLVEIYGYMMDLFGVMLEELLDLKDLKEFKEHKASKVLLD